MNNNYYNTLWDSNSDRNINIYDDESLCNKLKCSNPHKHIRNKYYCMIVSIILIICIPIAVILAWILGSNYAQHNRIIKTSCCVTNNTFVNTYNINELKYDVYYLGATVNNTDQFQSTFVNFPDNDLVKYLNKYTVGNNITCYYDPDNVQSLFINNIHSMSDSQIFGMFVGGCTEILLIIMIIILFRLKN